MDWVVDARSQPAVSDAATAVIDQLRRHENLPGSAELIAGTVREAVSAAAGGAATLWVRLSWDAEEPTLTIRTSDQELLAALPGATDEQLIRPADEHSRWLLDRLEPSSSVEMALPVPRAQVSPVVPAGPGAPAPESGHTYQSFAAVTLARRDHDVSPEEVCSEVGWAAGEAATLQWAAAHDGRVPGSAEESADAFCDFMNRSGADFFVVDRSPRRTVVANRNCPFGPGVAGAGALCQSTSSLAGSIAARASGEALVVVDETIADGDARCRVVIDLDRAHPYGQRYRHPPTRPANRSDRRQKRRAGRFRVEMSLHLPRDGQSVRLTRHLIGHAMSEIGVRASDIDDVALAVTEAAANVIDHAEESDDYRVTFTVGADLAEIRVIDTGNGFDHESLGRTSPDLDVERGRGLLLMQALVDQARFASRPERGTIVHLTKRLHFNGGPAAWLQTP